MSYILSKKPVSITAPASLGFLSQWIQPTIGVLPLVLFLALPEAPGMALGTPSHVASTYSMLLSSCFFTMLLVSSSSLYLYGFRLFLCADNSQIHTSSPFEPQTLDSNDSWTSISAWMGGSWLYCPNTHPTAQARSWCILLDSTSLSYSTAIQQQVLWILPSKSLPNPYRLSSLPPPH